MSTLLEQYKGKTNGSTLTAEEWNECLSTIETGINNAAQTGGSGGSGGSFDSNFEISSKGNFTVKSTKNINLEPVYNPEGDQTSTYGDIVFKPGDDIELQSHHRTLKKRNEISIKVNDGGGNAAKPVELQINLKDLTLSTKDKDGAKSEELNVDIVTGSASGNSKGYLKVRARAIDLRCEEHGGIALLPMGSDSDGNMNKVKFEHGGGDGLEFGTFNAEKTSIFTDEYRFNKDGIWKMATRVKLDNTEGASGNDKYKPGESDETLHYSYKKNNTLEANCEAPDDFYDFINVADEQTNTSAIIKTANALNYGKDRSCKMDGEVKGQAGMVYSNLEIKTKTTYKWYLKPSNYTLNTAQEAEVEELTEQPNTTDVYNIKDELIATDGVLKYIPSTLKLNKEAVADQAWNTAKFYKYNGNYYVLHTIASPGIKLESEGNVKLISNKKIAFETPNISFNSNQGNVSIVAGDSIDLDKGTLGVPGVVLTAPIVKHDNHIIHAFNSISVSATGKLEDGGYLQVAGLYNLQHTDVKYDKTNGKVYVLIEPVYDANGNRYMYFDVPAVYDSTNKTKLGFAYWDEAHTQLCRYTKEGVAESGAKVFLPEKTNSNNLWVLDTTKNGEIKAAKSAFDSATGQLSTGDAEHVKCAEKTAEGVYTGLAGTEYANTVYVTSWDKIPADVVTETVTPKREWQANTQLVSFSDIVKLVLYMKVNNPSIFV